MAAAASLLFTVNNAEAQTYYVDFGSGTSTSTDDALNIWNTVPNTTAFSDTGFTTLFDSTGMEMISLQMVRRFNGENTNGINDGTGPFPASATRDSLFGNTEAFGVGPNIRPAFLLTGLDATKSYNLTFYASRMVTVPTDIRTTEYVVTGGISGSSILNALNNVTNVATTFGISPDPQNEILIELFPAADNNNSNHFTYLGVMKVEVVPEPTSALMVASGVGILALRRRRRTA